MGSGCLVHAKEAAMTRQARQAHAWNDPHGSPKRLGRAAQRPVVALAVRRERRGGGRARA
jgi:hypothetical protein